MDSGKKILVVEDSDIQRTICTSQLQVAGFENVEVAEDGNVAYSRLEEGGINLVICDLVMPKMNGMELLKKVKRNPNLQHIPFIMLSSTKDDKLCQEAINEGALDYIVKPGKPGLFKEKLGKIS